MLVLPYCISHRVRSQGCQSEEQDHVRKSNRKTTEHFNEPCIEMKLLVSLSQVLLVVVEGRKVRVEIDTTKTEAFFYDPTWDNPAVQVTEANYEGL